MFFLGLSFFYCVRIYSFGKFALSALIVFEYIYTYIYIYIYICIYISVVLHNLLRCVWIKHFTKSLHTQQKLKTNEMKWQNKMLK